MLAVYLQQYHNVFFSRFICSTRNCDIDDVVGGELSIYSARCVHLHTINTTDKFIIYKPTGQQCNADVATGIKIQDRKLSVLVESQKQEQEESVLLESQQQEQDHHLCHNYASKSSQNTDYLDISALSDQNDTDLTTITLYFRGSNADISFGPIPPKSLKATWPNYIRTCKLQPTMILDEFLAKFEHSFIAVRAGVSYAQKCNDKHCGDIYRGEGYTHWKTNLMKMIIRIYEGKTISNT